MVEKSARQRIVHWDDPKALMKAGQTLSGRDFLEAWRKGELPPPPICQLLDFTLEEVDDGRAALVIEPHESQYNPMGSVHGGIAATMLDSAMGLAVCSKCTAGRTFTTLEIKVNYLRAMSIETGPVRAIGRVIHFGRQIAMAEASLVDSSGKLYAQASSTVLLVDIPPKRTE